MLAYGYRKFGGPAVFETLTQPTLTPTANQIVVDTLAVNLNDEDRIERLGTNADVPLPMIPGHDVVGRVSAVGSAVTDVALDTIVAAHTEHTYAEQVCLNADRAVPVPDGLTPTQAVSVITPGITAYKAVRYFADVQANQTVIVKGAAGGVGTMAVQLAQRMGAHVIAVASQQHADEMAALGVQQFVAYDHHNPAHVLADQGDVVINVALNGVDGKADLAMAKFDATIASVATRLPATSKSIRFRSIHETNAISDQAALQMLFKLLATDQLITQIGYQLPFTLDGFIQGHTLLDEPHDGRIVIEK
ncbi:NADP-dependent oxidoreductase [Lactiplantibacillus fabifermentans]|uniref:Oxidoreductase n=2 Tax=Lactiplantibacillus fabifermentans TaxID=483011 RepID=A0A0R2NS57_9LACO|nr:NADP-dependent oxidoreductase [Lactiplantibacillus fabifermentans]ETY75605.1 alcohol dehydrogenase [Lactiplantibacillus fabifermentans T30PCM01]KRO28494.1 oxidoreductase [Lactiplantibacillus fabifermentans DSM 21115]